MRRNYSSVIFIFICLLMAASAEGRASKPVSYSTSPKTVTAESSGRKIETKATFTVTTANVDDTITGILVYTVADEARKTLAQLAGKDISSIPTGVVNKDVTAVFRKGSSCPNMQIEIEPAEAQIAGITLSFKRMILDLNESNEKMPQLFCSWTRQINAGRQRRGIIAAINRLLNSE